MSGPAGALLVVCIALFATIGWVMYLVADSKKRHERLKAQSEVNGRLLDKFGSAREVIEFLQTPGGAQFVESVAAEREEPAAGILRSTHRGIILAVVAAGCLALAWHYRYEENPLLVIGVVLLCLGIGFLISAAVSHRLTRTLGLDRRGSNPQ